MTASSAKPEPVWEIANPDAELSDEAIAALARLLVDLVEAETDAESQNTETGKPDDPSVDASACTRHLASGLRLELPIAYCNDATRPPHATFYGRPRADRSPFSRLPLLIAGEECPDG